MGADFREVVTHPTYSLPFLSPGRLVKIKHQDLDFGWGIVVNYQKRLPPKHRPVPTASDDVPAHEQYILDVLLNCSKESTLPKDRAITTPTPGGVMPCTKGAKGEPLVVPVLLSTVESISHIRLFLPKDIRQLQARETMWKSVLEVQRRFPNGITLLDPVENMGIKDERFQLLVQV
jgi:ATP-dependent RNA helicase DOB1